MKNYYKTYYKKLADKFLTAAFFQFCIVIFLILVVLVLSILGIKGCWPILVSTVVGIFYMFKYNHKYKMYLRLSQHTK